MNCVNIEYNYPSLIIILALLVLFVLAFFWEIKDYQRLESRTPICQIKNKEKRKKELEFYACFNSENNVQWRGIFIMTFFATLLVLYVIYVFYGCIDINLALLVFGAILLVFYIGDTFKTFHLYRNMCGKVRSDRTIL